MKKFLSIVMFLALLIGGTAWAQSSTDGSASSGSKTHSKKGHAKKKSKSSKSQKKKGTAKKSKKSKKGSKDKSEPNSDAGFGKSDVEIDLKGK